MYEDTYHGERAFSEVEMKAAGDHLKSLGFVEGYADVHAFSQYWMYPYGYGFLWKHQYKIY